MHNSVFLNCQLLQQAERSRDHYRCSHYLIWNTHTQEEYLSSVRRKRRMGVLLIRSEPSEELVAAQDPGSRAQIIRGALCSWGHTGVETHHLISCHKARQPINKAAEQLLEKATAVREHAHTYIYIYMDGLCVFVFTVRLGNVPSFLLMTDTPRQLHAHVLTQVHTQTHTHPDRCCIVMACPTLAACFPQTSHPVWWLRDGEMKGEAGTRGGGEEECWTLTGGDGEAWDSSSARRLSKSYH